MPSRGWGFLGWAFFLANPKIISVMLFVVKGLWFLFPFSPSRFLE